jgi:hypothetical protein
MGRTEEAIATLEPLVDVTLPAAQYPGLGARRTLIGLLRRVGRDREAHEHLQLCWMLTQDASVGETARKVGAVAAAEDRLAAECDGRPPSVNAGDIDAVWQSLFGNAAMAEVVRTWVY